MTTIMGIAQPIIIDLEWVAAATGGGWGVTKYLQLDWMDGKSFTTTMSFI
jgi:hypothetical protein